MKEKQKELTNKDPMSGAYKKILFKNNSNLEVLYYKWDSMSYFIENTILDHKAINEQLAKIQNTKTKLTQQMEYLNSLFVVTPNTPNKDPIIENLQSIEPTNKEEEQTLKNAIKLVYKIREDFKAKREQLKGANDE